MTYSYAAMPYGQGQINNQANFIPQAEYYPNMQQGSSSIISGVVPAACLGFAGGALCSAGANYIKNRKPVKNGEVSDSFAKSVMDRIVDKGYTVKGREFFRQKFELLKNLSKVNSPEQFVSTMKKYKNYASTICNGISLNSMCKMVNKDNLSGKIETLKKRIEAGIESEMQNIKDSVKLCWDEENKKFVKPNTVDEKIYNVIKSTKNSVQWKKVLKTGGITACVCGALAVAYNLLAGNK